MSKVDGNDSICINLPSPLTANDGKAVITANDWVNRRREEILEFFRREVYGYLPPRPDRMETEVITYNDKVFDGAATRKEIRVTFRMNNGKQHSFLMLVYIPNKIAKPVPVFVGLNFKGNHATATEDAVTMTGTDLYGNRIGKRAEQAHRWQFEETIRRGFASATVCYHDIFPDETADPVAFRRSVYDLFYPEKSVPEIHEKGSAISAWAWGLSRMLDALETEPAIDTEKAIVHGHSRLGKTALWAGANDPRFKIVISNDSGCCGASLNKHHVGETITILQPACPFWFVPTFRQYVGKETVLPYDQHWLMALTAPRWLCVASASEDLWADPEGEFLGAKAVSEVYRLFGSEGLPADTMPSAGTFVTGDVSYHLRSGKHDQQLFDWEHYWKLAELRFQA